MWTFPGASPNVRTNSFFSSMWAGCMNGGHCTDRRAKGSSCAPVARVYTRLCSKPLRHRSFPFLVAALAMLLTLGSLRVGWCFDDYYQRWIICGSPAYTDVARRPLDAFCFFDGDVHRNQRMIEHGLAPWWINPHLKVAFWKPVTVLTHMIDYRLWPRSPALMHVQNIFWFGLWVLAAGLLYRQVMHATVAAALGTLLYALDHSRAVPVAWLANRNAVLAGLFGILAIYAHIRSLQREGITWRFLSPF